MITPWVGGMRRVVLRAGVALALWVAGPASAAPAALQRVELPGGEVLIGTVEVEADGAWWVVTSPTLGALRVPAAGAKQTPLVGGGAVSVAPAAPMPEVVAAPAVAAPVPASPPVAAPRAVWKRRLEGGYNYQANGSNVATHSTFVRGEISRVTPSGSNVLEARYYYGRQNAQRNDDRLAIALKTRESIRRRVDFRNDLSYGYDYLKKLSHQFEDVFGLTFIVVDDAKYRFAIGPGVGLQYAEPALGETGYKVVGDVSADARWNISERVSLTNRSSYLFKPQSMKDYRLRSESALTVMLNVNLSMNLRYEYEYEAIRPVAAGRSDNRVFTGLSYEF